MRQQLLDGLGAGLAATLLVTGVAFALPASGSPMPWWLMRLLRDLAEHPLWLALAMTAHLGYGGLAGALYFGGARRVTLAGGMIYGFGLWGVAVALYAPLCGLGFVASHRPALAVWALPAHLLYGVALSSFRRRGEILQPI
jgi:hypothetical protein